MAREEEPHWAALLAEEAWTERIMPLLKSLQEATILALLKPERTATLEQVRFLQGKAAAYRELLTEPEARVREEERRKAEEQEESDAGGRAEYDPGDVLRRRRA